MFEDKEERNRFTLIPHLFGYCFVFGLQYENHNKVFNSI